MMGGGSLDEALSQLETGEADSVVVLENDCIVMRRPPVWMPRWRKPPT